MQPPRCFCAAGRPLTVMPTDHCVSIKRRQAMPGDDSRAEIMRLAAEFRALRDVELALHVPVVGDAVSPFMAPPDTDPAALRAADSLLVLPSDPTAAIEEVLRRREEGGFSYFVVGANAADALAPVVAELTGH